MKLLISTVIAAMLLSGCSSSDSSDDSTPATQPKVKTGVFVDAAVQGLTFSTKTQNGITNVKGEFTFLDGETVTFSLGNIDFGSTTGKSRVTPVDMVRGAKDASNIEVQNILRLLQTLDADRDPSNGIDVAGVQNKQFSGAETFDFKVDAVLSEIVAQVKDGLVIVDAETAIKHFKDTLDAIEKAEKDKEVTPPGNDGGTAVDNSGAWTLTLSGSVSQGGFTTNLPVSKISVKGSEVPTSKNQDAALDGINAVYQNIDFTIVEESATKVVWKLKGSSSVDVGGQVITTSYDLVYTYTKN